MWHDKPEDWRDKVAEWRAKPAEQQVLELVELANRWQIPEPQRRLVVLFNTFYKNHSDVIDKCYSATRCAKRDEWDELFWKAINEELGKCAEVPQLQGKAFPCWRGLVFGKSRKESGVRKGKPKRRKQKQLGLNNSNSVAAEKSERFELNVITSNSVAEKPERLNVPVAEKPEVEPATTLATLLSRAKTLEEKKRQLQAEEFQLEQDARAVFSKRAA